MTTPTADPYSLPPDLPVPQDCSACDHLSGLRLPRTQLFSTEGASWSLSELTGKIILYVYPASGVPGKDPIPDWDTIPGAPGCTLQSLGFAAHYQQFRQLGYQVLGISSQLSNEQFEFKQRTGLPFSLLSDPDFELRNKLGLPTFHASGKSFYKRLALVVVNGQIRQVFYPVFPPDQCAAKVLAWVKSNPLAAP